MEHTGRPTARELLTAFVAFVIFAALALGVNPFRGQIIGPFDLLLSQPGWGSTVGFDQVHHAERSDVLDYYLPRWIEAREELRRGHLPLWNPLPAGGEPGLLNLASGELTPAFLLFAAFPSPALGLLAAVLFNLAFGATGVYAFMRRHGGVLPALFSGATFMLCGFNAGWLYWPHVSTALWIGWLLWGMDRAALAGARCTVAGIAVPLVGLLLGGFPFISLLGLGAGGLYLACGAALDPERRRGLYFRRCAIALVVALGIALPGLLSFAEWLKDFALTERFTGSQLSHHDMVQLLPHGARHQPIVESSMYVGALALVLAIALLVTVAVSLVRRRRVAVSAAFSVALMVIASILVFELVPRALLADIPGLANNRWQRASCILDLSLAIAAGAFLVLIEARVRKWVFIPIAACLLVVQAVDAATFFRLFNGPVPAETYYPRLALVEQARAIRIPFQSAVADDSFLVSGTLGAYGVAEWFGHGFRTESLKKAMTEMATDATTTATASRIDGGRFHLDSPLYSALGIRYALGGEAMVTRAVGLPAGASAANQVPMPPMPGAVLVQHVRLDTPSTVEAISLSLATYGRHGQQGTLHVELARAGVPTPVAMWNIPASTVADNQVRAFPLATAPVLEAGEYLVTVSYLGAAAGDMLTVWSYPGHWDGCSATANGEAVPGCMAFAFRVKRADLGTFAEIANDNGVHLLENKDAPAGPYFLPALTDMPHGASSDPVARVGNGTSRIALRYAGGAPGFVVVPMSWRGGWRVTRNGEPVRPQKYLGIMPAIPVAGPADIMFSYRPLGLLVGGPVSLLTLLGLAIGSWWTGRTQRLSGGRPAPR